jgi:hypothetical protein
MKKGTKLKPLPKGFTCDCGAVHGFPPYVYAHWDEILQFTCPNCERTYEVLHGNTEEM